MRLAVFCYDFPHRKSVDVLMRLFVEGVSPRVVYGAPRKKLNIAPRLRGAVHCPVTLHPERVAATLWSTASYMRTEHEVVTNENGCDLALIAGARILPKQVIDSFPFGVINLHPAPLPEARGLGCLYKTLAKGITPAVTAHLIDERVDAGTVLLREDVPWVEGDTIYDVSERLYQKQLDMIAPAIRKAVRRKVYPA